MVTVPLIKAGVPGLVRELCDREEMEVVVVSKENRDSLRETLMARLNA